MSCFTSRDQKSKWTGYESGEQQQRESSPMSSECKLKQLQNELLNESESFSDVPSKLPSESVAF